jgi:hypothetical protein
MKYEKTTLEFVASVYTLLSQAIMKQHHADLIIDIPQTVETLEAGNAHHELIRKLGADPWSRFTAICEEDGKEPTDENVYKTTEYYFTWLVDVTLYPDQSVEVRFNKSRMNGNGDILNSVGDVELYHQEINYFMERTKDRDMRLNVKVID